MKTLDVGEDLLILYLALWRDSGQDVRVSLDLGIDEYLGLDAWRINISDKRCKLNT